LFFFVHALCTVANLPRHTAELLAVALRFAMSSIIICVAHAVAGLATDRSENRGMLASAALDREVLLWDVEALQSVSAMPSRGGEGNVSFIKASGHQDSIYCLATNASGSVVVSGSTERVSTHAIGLLRIWDPRSGEKVQKPPFKFV